MPTTAEAEIRAIIADQLAALHDHDPERMLADYTADVVQYTLAPRCSTAASTSRPSAPG